MVKPGTQGKITKMQIIVVLLLILLAGAGVYLWENLKNDEGGINSFEECAAAGNAISLSNPAQCYADGKGFTEKL